MTADSTPARLSVIPTSMSSILHSLTQFVLLAQENGAAGGGAADGGAGEGGGGGLFGDPFLPLIVMVVFLLFYVMVMRPQRQKQKDAQVMMENLKENDEVVTIGGIVGSIVSFSKDGKEVTLRTDEKTNTKLRVLRSHISRPLKAEADEEAEAKDLNKK